MQVRFEFAGPPSRLRLSTRSCVSERLEDLNQRRVEQPFNPLRAFAPTPPLARRACPPGRALAIVEVKPTISLVTEPDQRKWAAAAERCAYGGRFPCINPATSTSLGHLPAEGADSPPDHLKTARRRQGTIGWHQGRQTKRSPSNIKDFAALVLRGSINPHRAGDRPAWHDYQARNWASGIDITPERLHPAMPGRPIYTLTSALPR